MSSDKVVILSYSYVQIDSEGKVSILGSGSKSHCETKSVYEHVSNTK